MPDPGVISGSGRSTVKNRVNELQRREREKVMGHIQYSETPLSTVAAAPGHAIGLPTECPAEALRLARDELEQRAIRADREWDDESDQIPW
jgi:ABC-type glutathione transport system ATPase component